MSRPNSKNRQHSKALTYLRKLPISRSHKLLLVTLLHFESRPNTSFSVEEEILAELTGYTRSGLRKLFKELADLGLLEYEPPTRDKNKHKFKLTYAQPPKQPPKASKTKTKTATAEGNSPEENDDPEENSDSGNKPDSEHSKKSAGNGSTAGGDTKGTSPPADVKPGQDEWIELPIQLVGVRTPLFAALLCIALLGLIVMVLWPQNQEYFRVLGVLGATGIVISSVKAPYLTTQRRLGVSIFGWVSSVLFALALLATRASLA